MARFSLTWLFVVLMLCGLAFLAWVTYLGHRPLPLADIQAVRRGMTMDQVRQLMGNPDLGTVNKGQTSLWIYNWVTNDWACKVYFDSDWRVDGLAYRRGGTTTWAISDVPEANDNAEENTSPKPGMAKP